MKRVSNYNKLEMLFSGISLFLTTTMITSSRDSCSSGSNRRHLFHQKVVVASPLPGRAETTECGGAGYRGSYRNFDRSSSWISVTARSTWWQNKRAQRAHLYTNNVLNILFSFASTSSVPTTTFKLNVLIDMCG